MAVARVTQSQDQLREQLRDQLRFLETSAASFDAGFDGEAKRMAVCARVLCHDTRQSVSLLAQLSLKGIDFYDRAYPDPARPGFLTSPFQGLVQMRLSTGGGGSGHVAPLDDRPPGLIHSSPFQVWWDSVVLNDGHGNRLSRAELVLHLSNKDGGAHVDPHLDATYAAISQAPGFGWKLTDSRGSRPLPGRVERVSMRQIAHELLRTLETHR